MMPMILTNGRTAPRQTLQTAQRSLALAPIPVVKSMNNSMIARIHNLKPGCGSCGRH
jgi:hypothetical protein